MPIFIDFLNAVLIRLYGETGPEDRFIDVEDLIDLFFGNSILGVKLKGDERNDVLEGTPYDDEIEGKDGNDLIIGLDGDDELDGDDGNDTILGGGGNDDIDGDDGADSLDGGDDDDTIEGGDGKDTILGGAGEDALEGGRGGDDIKGGADNDVIRGEAGKDLIDGGEGDDRINGGSHDDTMMGGEGNDTITGRTGEDTAVFRGSILDFEFPEIFVPGQSFFVTDMNTQDGDEGTDRVNFVEFLQFDDFIFEVGGDNAPLLNAQDVTTDEDTPVSFTVSAVDFDGDALSVDSLSFSIVGEGSAVLDSRDILPTNTGAGETFTFEFDPSDHFDALAFGESVVQTITVEISDANHNSSTIDVDVTINGVNDPTQTLNLPLTFDEAAGTFVIDLNTQVFDPDAPELNFSNINLDRDGTVIPFEIIGNGLIRIDPTTISDFDFGDTLEAAFTYDVNDGSGMPIGMASGIVPLTINGADDDVPPPPPDNLPPMANAFEVTADEEDGVVSISMADLVSDPNVGDILTITSLTVSTDDPDLPNVAPTFSGGITTAEGGKLTIDLSTLGLVVDDGETQTFTLNYTVEDDGGLSAQSTITLELIGDTPGGGNTPPAAQDIPGAAGYPIGPDGIPGDVIVDDPGVLTFVVDFDDLISDAETPDSELIVTPGDLVIGQNESTGEAITIPYTYDSETKVLTVTLADVGLEDGEEVLAVMNYSVSDGTDTTNGQIAVNFVDPTDDAGPQSLIIDFEQFAAPDPDFAIQIPGVDGFTFLGSATVIETDELAGSGGDRAPAGIVSGQTTPGGDNVLVGTSSVQNVPLLDEFGEPVLGDRGEPLFEEVVENFAIFAPDLTLAPGETLGPSALVQQLSTTTSGFASFFETNADEASATFALDGLSLNVVSNTVTTVTITAYSVQVVEDDLGTGQSDYSIELIEVDSFDFLVSGADPATMLDFNGNFLPDGATPEEIEAAQLVFDNVDAIEITAADGSSVVLDDIMLTNFDDLMLG